MKPGMRLARAVVSDKGQTIAASGAVLTVALVNAIYDANVLQLCIQDDPALNLPPESRLEDDPGAAGTAGADAAAITAEGWINLSRELFLSCVREKTLNLKIVQQLGDSCLMRLAKESPYSILARNDPAANYLPHHSLNVCIISVSVAQAMGLAAAEVWDIFVGALLHDIGMIQVPEHMWLSPKPLSAIFKTEIEKHPTDGFNVIRRADGAKEIWAHLTLDHHERLDGSGYPNHKPAQHLTIQTRILAVCDVYAALLMPRAWRPAVMPDKAIKELIAHPEKFDKQVVGRLLQRVGIFPVGCIVKLSDGRKAEVVGHNAASPLRPVVMDLDGPRPQKIDLAGGSSPGISVMEILPAP